MAVNSVTGKTNEELERLREEHDHPTSFEKCYCLAKIPRQPEDYDGPVRYCVSRKVIHPHWICKHHGGAGSTEGLDKLAGMKHGMNASVKHLIEDFSDADQELYDWITQEWPEAYDIDVSEDPQAKYRFHELAVEMVRNERASGYIIRQGEENSKKVFGPNGEVEYENVPHYLSDMLQRNRKLVMKMEDNLGISRKKRLQNEKEADATEVMKSFAEVGASLITGADEEYDPGKWDKTDA
ncbi:hypothetical protein [Halocatena halophila]|uniref:hypothetical protein n=1 Tax=Halocatena halophila TaxID=2814576 RepID=UPI002ED48F10